MSPRTLTMTEPLLDYLLAMTREHPVMRRVREETQRLPGAGMQIAAEQGQFMGFIAGLVGARRALELGTYTGYSALAVALALPKDGKLICCDVNEETTALARRFWAEAGVDDRIELRLGPGLDTLNALIAAGDEGQFDLVFIDADKPNYDAYYEGALRLLRPGGLVLLDNMLWDGQVADAKARDATTRGLRALNAKIHGDARVDMCLLPLGDGVMLARKR